jgi:hypothetical protein
MNTSLLTTAHNCWVENIKLVETNASPINAAKNGAANCGLTIAGQNNIIKDVESNGFGFPFMCRASDDTCDNVRFEGCTGHNGYSWGFELDSVKNATFIRCTAYDNGLDGFKAQNEYTRTCDGLLYAYCISHSNGRRDTAGGGAEATNGNGFDFYQGGWRFRMIGCRAYDNWGSNFNIKGSSDVNPVQGESVVSGCVFTGAKATGDGAKPHGVEIGTEGGTGGSFITFDSCVMSSNKGGGIFVGGGQGLSFTNCSVIDNESYGVADYTGSDHYYTNCFFLRNRGYTFLMGSSNTNSMTPRRINVRDCVLSASFDDSVGSYENMYHMARDRYVMTAESGTDIFTASGHNYTANTVVQTYTWAGTLPTGLSNAVQYYIVNPSGDTLQLATSGNGTPVNITTNGAGVFYITKDGETGVRTYSDSAELLFDGCLFYNYWSTAGGLQCYSHKTIIKNCTFKGQGRSALYIGASGHADISECHFEDTDNTMSQSYGDIRVDGTARIDNCDFIHTDGAYGTARAIHFIATARNCSFDRIRTTNFGYKARVDAGSTWSTDWVQQVSATAAPASAVDYFITGAVAWNLVPASGQPIFWRCSASGNPGTWMAGPNN